MQLFITSYNKKGNTITIENKEILNQIRKVLRLQKGDIINVQNDTTRYEIQIIDRADTDLTGEIKSTQEYSPSPHHHTMIIGMPNKRDKVELIVQKLTEIGIDKIVFWPTERSVIKERNSNKEERILKIAKEAVEQSRGWKTPIIMFTKDILPHIEKTKCIIYDTALLHGKPEFTTQQETRNICGIIGPEGGLTANDYKNFSTISYEIKSLGETILRTETAAIIAGRQIKNA